MLTLFLTAALLAAPSAGAVPTKQSFLDRVIPVLTRYGCNAGACHGAAAGKNGFHLSLLGYDPEGDYEALVRQAGGRRLVRSNPSASLLLLKPSGAVPHAGGVRLPVGSAEFRILADWIAEGAPGPDPKEPVVERIEVQPAAASLRPKGACSLRVVAHYGGGAARDVTALSRFACNQEPIARVDASGRVTMLGTGEAVVRASFRGQVAAARLVVPYPGAVPPGDPWAAERSGNPVDRAVFGKLRRLRIVPAPGCTDAELLRRAALDLTGAIPAPEEVRRFLKEAASAKGGGQDARVRLIDSLLESPGYVDLWSYRMGDLLRSTRARLAPKGNRRFHAWLREQVASNRPWDQTVRDLLTSRGSLWEVGPANFYGTASGPAELAEVTSQEFLGIRLQCARCHDHPFDRWTQADYYHLAAFFAKVNVKSGGERGDMVVVLSDTGEVKHPRTAAVVAARTLDGKVEGQEEDPRPALAAWITAPENPWFARNIANRVWKYLMGRGLVDPVDDIRTSNPPSNEEALQVLASYLTRNGYDLKGLIRLIVTSRAYQLSVETNPSNRFDEAQFSHRVVRRLTAEQLLDSIVAATGVPERFTGMPAGTRAAQLPDTSVPNYLLDLFGRPARASVCECERETEPNLAQALHIMNGETINRKIAAPEGRLTRLLQSGAGDGEVVEELFLATLSRPPSAAERKAVLTRLAGSGTRREAFSDLFWALLNSREFLFTH